MTTGSHRIVDLVDPAHTALVTVEAQDDVLGDESPVPELAVAAAPILPRIAELAVAARAVGVPVVHCTADSRPDRLGANRNARIFAALGTGPAGATGPTQHATLHPSIGAADADLVLGRLHGVSPMTGTSLDPVLRNLDVTTVVAVGVSVNVAVLGLAFEAVNHGYRIVIPADAVAGVGDDYVEAVLAGTLSLLATLTTTDAVLAAWRPS